MLKRIVSTMLWTLAVASVLLVLSLDLAQGDEVRKQLNVVYSRAGGSAGGSEVIAGSGVSTFGPSGSGVSVMMIVDLETLDPSTEIYSFQVGTIYFSDDYKEDPNWSGATSWTVSGLTNLNPGGTGVGTSTTAGGSGASVTFVYGISNKRLTVAEWEKKGQSGTTAFRTMLVNSGNTDEPTELTPEVCAELMIGVYSAVSQFRVPEGWLVVQ